MTGQPRETATEPSDAPPLEESGGARKVLANYGRRGDRVKVVEDVKEDSVIVYYRDRDGKARRRLYARTGAGRKEAKAFAEGWLDARTALTVVPAPPEQSVVTTASLWRAYHEHELDGHRAATVTNYTSHWKRWAAFIGAATPVDSVTMIDGTKFRKELARVGIALNQARLNLKLVQLVYRWGQRADLVRLEGVLKFRWTKNKDDKQPLEPAEYTDDQFERLLRNVDRGDYCQWRAWVFLMLAGVYGQRARALRHLRWRDIDYAADTIAWQGEYQKQGETLKRPILWAAHAALVTARQARQEALLRRVRKHAKLPNASPERLQQDDWVFFSERDKAKPMSYSSLHYHLRQAETRAGVPHQDYRAVHGLRRMVVGRVGQQTGDRLVGLEWVGDAPDPKLLKSYDKRLDERIDAAAKSFESVRQVSGNDTAASERGGAV